MNYKNIEKFAWSLTDGRDFTDEEFNDRNLIRELVQILRDDKRKFLRREHIEMIKKYELDIEL